MKSLFPIASLLLITPSGDGIPTWYQDEFSPKQTHEMMQHLVDADEVTIDDFRIVQSLLVDSMLLDGFENSLVKVINEVGDIKMPISKVLESLRSAKASVLDDLSKEEEKSIRNIEPAVNTGRDA